MDVTFKQIVGPDSETFLLKKKEKINKRASNWVFFLSTYKALFPGKERGRKRKKSIETKWSHKKVWRDFGGRSAGTRSCFYVRFMYPTFREHHIYLCKRNVPRDKWPLKCHFKTWNLIEHNSNSRTEQNFSSLFRFAEIRAKQSVLLGELINYENTWFERLRIHLFGIGFNNVLNFALRFSE